MITELSTKLESNNILAWNAITVDVNGNDITISSQWGWVAPFLDPNNLTLVNNTNYTLNLEGQYFIPTTDVSVSSWWANVNSITALSPNTLEINITTGTVNGTYDVILDNNGAVNTIWPSNGQNYITLIDPITWTGPAGTYTETFETNLWNWFDWGWQQAWTRDSAWTPSNGTWPTTGAGSAFYIFTETSTNGTWFPNRTFILETTNFNIAQSISFDYHAFGATIGTLELQTLFNWVWTTRNTISWQQQAAQGDAYINETVDLSFFPVESIRFLYTSGTDFTWDIALDNISIVSN